MKVALVLYPDFNPDDVQGVVEPLSRQGRLDLVGCMQSPFALQKDGLDEIEVGQSLAGFDALVVPGGPGAEKMAADPTFLGWLGAAAGVPVRAAVGDGASLLASAGLLVCPVGQRSYREALDPAPGYPQHERFVLAPGTLLSQSGATARDLGLQLCERLLGVSAREPFDAAGPVSGRGVDEASFAAVTSRRATVERQTNETRVRVSLDLDGSGRHTIATGLGFLDHMLAQLALHGLFDLEIEAQGDLQVDPHHTVEDVALTLGAAFWQALGDRKGIVRMGSALVPMDDSLAQVVVDLSGRPYAVVDVHWIAPFLGNIPTSLFAHFLESFAIQARCNLHVRVLAGRDDHHMAEAIFKGLARALDAAVRIDPRRAGKCALDQRDFMTPSTPILLVDVGTGNLHSVYHALLSLGCAVTLTADPDLVRRGGRILLPGVGAFGAFMDGLRQRGLETALLEAIRRGDPLLGICVGMQALMEVGEELGEHRGLGILPGRVVRFPALPGLKIPHTGWNQFWAQSRSSLLAGLPDGSYAYFNHSYYCAIGWPGDAVACTEYGVNFASIIQRENVAGIQFHPEKSQKVGLQLLANFVEAGGGAA